MPRPRADPLWMPLGLSEVDIPDRPEPDNHFYLLGRAMHAEGHSIFACPYPRRTHPTRTPDLQYQPRRYWLIGWWEGQMRK